MKKNAAILLLGLLLHSCGYFPDDKSVADSSPVVARVGDAELRRSEVRQVVRGGLRPQDSIMLVKSYIDRWALKQILLKKAEMNLPDDKKYKINRLAEEYKQDLYINYYKQALLSQYFDTVFTGDEIEKYYLNHPDLFKSDQYYLRCQILVFHKDSVPEKKVLKNLNGQDESMNYFMENAIRFDTLQLDADDWQSWNDIANEYPVLKNINLEEITGDVIERKNKDKIIIVKILNMVLPGEVKPMPIVEDEIKKMMLQRKKIDFLKKAEKDLIKDAVQNNLFERYE